MKVVIVGNQGGTNIGASMHSAAADLPIDAAFLDAQNAYRAPRWLRAFNWRLRGRRPTWLRHFSMELLAICQSFRPGCIISTGIAPIEAGTLAQLRNLEIRRLNFLTDDPWNPSHYAKWFLRALPHYDLVFSPRRANLNDLYSLGCPRVEYLPFGYDERLFFRESCQPGDNSVSVCDVSFAGGAEPARVAYVAALVDAGFTIRLYGDFWERFSTTRRYAAGHADPTELRRTATASKIVLCLVRRANRDGHVMRTFETAASGACMLVEDTAEHRDIFGADRECVVYFTSPAEMVERARQLLSDDMERQRLADAVHQRIVAGRNTYRDRLQTMLQAAEQV